MRHYFSKTNGTSEEAIKMLKRIYKKRDEFTVCRQHEDDFCSSPFEYYKTNRDGLIKEWNRIYHYHNFLFNRKVVFTDKEIWFVFVRENQVYYYMFKEHYMHREVNWNGNV